jgi:putative transposase
VVVVDKNTMRRTPRVKFIRQDPFYLSEQSEGELLWSILQGEDDPLDLLFDEFRNGAKRFLEWALDVEMENWLGYKPYERGEDRPDQRNGYTYRCLESVFGFIENLAVPRTRRNRFKSKVIKRYQRRQKQVADLVRSMFTRGVSTRQIGEVLTPLLGITPSAQTVSNIAKDLDDEVRRFRSRQLSDEYIYLIFDGVTMRVKEAPGVSKKLVLVAYGIKRDGTREVISFRQESAESQPCWQKLLNDLYRRGLKGESLKLIVTDGCPGLIGALEEVYPDTPRQRCWAHKLRNVANCCRKANEQAVISDARPIYLADTRREARSRYLDWKAKWESLEAKAVACLGRDLESMLTFLDLPAEHRKMMRTTNIIERLFREVRRRTNPMTCFANAASCDRIIYSVFVRFNHRWESRPLANFTQQG